MASSHCDEATCISGQKNYAGTARLSAAQRGWFLRSYYCCGGGVGLLGGFGAPKPGLVGEF